MNLTPKPPPGYCAPKERRGEYSATVWMREHMAHLEPVHVWKFEPLMDGYVCLNLGCGAMAKLGDSITLPCVGRAAG